MNKPVLSHTIPPEDEAAFRAAVREGVAAADAGKLSLFEPLAEWLASWGSEKESPPPEWEFGSRIRPRRISPKSGSICKAKVRPPRAKRAASFSTLA